MKSKPIAFMLVMRVSLGWQGAHSVRAAAGRESPDLITRLAPRNRPAPLLPLLHKLVEERAGDLNST
jgi:hypothetical protein